MNTHAGKTQENKIQSASAANSQKQSGGEPTFQFVDNRPETIAQRKLQEMANNSPQAKQAAQLQTMADSYSDQHQHPIQRKENNTGLPDSLKSGIENLSGYSMDDVKVHYNSDKPAQLEAHAYAQGTDIHIASGQEKHLPHEAWHVVQQKQRRVSPTLQMKGGVNVNDDAGLEKEADVMGAKALTSSQIGSSESSLSEVNSLPRVELCSNNAIQRKVEYSELPHELHDLYIEGKKPEKFIEFLDFFSSIPYHVDEGGLATPSIYGKSKSEFKRYLDDRNTSIEGVRKVWKSFTEKWAKSKDQRIARRNEEDRDPTPDFQSTAAAVDTSGTKRAEGDLDLDSSSSSAVNTPPPVAISSDPMILSVKPADKLPSQQIAPPKEAELSRIDQQGTGGGARTSEYIANPEAMKTLANDRVMDTYERGLLMVTSVQRRDLVKMHDHTSRSRIAEHVKEGKISMNSRDAGHGKPLEYAKVNWTLTSPRMQPHYFNMITDKSSDRKPKAEPMYDTEVGAPRVATLADPRKFGRTFMRGKTGKDDLSDWMEDQSSGKSARVVHDEPLFGYEDDEVIRKRFEELKKALEISEKEPKGREKNPEINTFGFPPDAVVGFLVTSGNDKDLKALKDAKEAMGKAQENNLIPYYTWEATGIETSPWVLKLLEFV